MMTPSFATPKYCVPFVLALCLAIVALYKVGDLRAPDAKMSLFGVTLCIENGKLELTENTKGSNKNLFSIISASPSRFNVSVLDKEIIHACPKQAIWITVVMIFLGIVAFRFIRTQKSTS